jgi:adenylyltransferase/sulfurtransferase
LCGRDSVQIHERSRTLDLAELGKRLRIAFAADGRDDARGNVRDNEFLLRFSVPPYEITVFADGRALVKGTQDPAIARSLYARFIGS